MEIWTNLDEKDVFAQFSENYALINPPPIYPARADWRSLGMIFYLKIITGLSSIMLVAMRTAGEFHRAAEIVFGNSTFASLEAVFAVLGIEGTMFVIGAWKAINRKGLVDESIAWFTVFLTLAISTVAGFAHSIRVVADLPGNVNSIITIVLSVIMTLASFVAYFSGELIGGDIAKLDIEYQRNLAEYKQEIDEWRNSLANSWRASSERKLARKQLNRALSDDVAPPRGETHTAYSNPHWRTLPDSEKAKVKSMELAEIMEAYNVSERTARNWTEYASNGSGGK